MRDRRLLLLNGPNLNMLGAREPVLYGSATLDDVVRTVTSAGDALASPIEVEAFQSNHEGALIDVIQGRGRTAAGIIINPGGFTHTSVALRDALAMTDAPIVEVHLTNIHAREEFRHRSFVAPIALGQIAGFGALGYLLAFQALVAKIDGIEFGQ